MSEEHIAVTRFREYLRVNTEQPNPDYAACRDFLFKYADELGIARRSFETVPGAIFVIMTIPGSQPELPSIMLYSHTDVVPTFREHWTHDPYSAFKDEDGNIFARGAQDMKCVGVQQMEALRNLFAQGIRQWKRTIHLVWGPDEEIFGINGMKGFAKTDEFKKLNLGFSLDEGMPSDDDVYKVFYAERVAWWVKVTFPGNPGHGSQFMENTAMEKLERYLASARKFRDEQKALLESNPDLTIGDVTTLNVNIVNGGVQFNVIPEKFEAFVDIRLTPSIDFNEMRNKLDQWVKDAGEGVTYEFSKHSDLKLVTPHTRDDPFWVAFEDSLKQEKCKFTTEVLIGSTDSRIVREAGVRAINFSPLINTPLLAHAHNEFLNEKVFLRGIEIYQTLINNVANVNE
ncbi:N-acyl-aliphatic-L-amino acid amidohydrolase [Caenorhabditis elegans]|uniref:N-acyl-aliphatic-L-amino acid amidohydrolase n=1 Tax=Caenorhabditis elegans TaxID=6239 RepID=Q17898_CAEEL|nr:N-acyl-aliphatic-L-amino acid amidohydrolase [Caenorhabditis elegans]CAA92445.1 N-acyl-aliphatic-L-amino acid amidohydrolase [Caenorhabditis elegans]|eukprot:NP_501650.1 Aminoacylase [Caenorhabditis elegans]